MNGLPCDGERIRIRPTTTSLWSGRSDRFSDGFAKVKRPSARWRVIQEYAPAYKQVARFKLRVLFHGDFSNSVVDFPLLTGIEHFTNLFSPQR